MTTHAYKILQKLKYVFSRAAKTNVATPIFFLLTTSTISVKNSKEIYNANIFETGKCCFHNTLISKIFLNIIEVFFIFCTVQHTQHEVQHTYFPKLIEFFNYVSNQDVRMEFGRFYARYSMFHGREMIYRATVNNHITSYILKNTLLKRWKCVIVSKIMLDISQTNGSERNILIFVSRFSRTSKI